MKSFPKPNEKELGRSMKRHIIFWTLLIGFLAAPKAHAIINGTLDTTHDSVGVVYYEGNAVTTGVLIDESWVLTVAHALEYGTASHFIIGDNFISPDSTVYLIDQIIVHPDFEMTGGLPVHNFALLHLTAPVHNVDILPRMTSPTLMVGTNALAIGYGATSNTNDDNTRRHFIMNAVDSTQSDTFTLEFASGGPCSGDSGGPCIINSGGADYIAGIISYGDCSTVTVCGKVSSIDAFITHTIASGDDVNHMPTAPGLLTPQDGATGIDPASVTFSWNTATDADGDAIRYQFYLSEDQGFAGCTPVNVGSKSAGSVHMAGFYGAGIFLCLLLAGLRKRLRRIPVVCLALLLCVFAACSDSSDTPAPENQTMSHIETGLNPATTYYWKVTANDGQGGVRTSDVRSFTTSGGL